MSKITIKEWLANKSNAIDIYFNERKEPIVELIRYTCSCRNAYEIVDIMHYDEYSKLKLNTLIEDTE